MTFSLKFQTRNDTCEYLHFKPVSHCFYEHGSVFLARDLLGLPDGVEHCQHVVTVHPHSQHAVPRPPRSYPVPPVLLVCRRRYRVTVVATVSLLYWWMCYLFF